jgi:broad specificity phosphatase PhoE
MIEINMRVARMNNNLLKFFGFLIIATFTAASNPLLADQRDIYLVRHAEKIVGANKDPSLTAKGFQRARNLAALLKNKQISRIYSTNYKRTKQTAAPLAKVLKQSVNLYDPGKLAEFAEQIKSVSGNLLIVGHSNTTPGLVSLLGGDPHGKIEESEYTRLYLLTINNGKVSTELLTTTADTQ